MCLAYWGEIYVRRKRMEMCLDEMCAQCIRHDCTPKQCTLKVLSIKKNQKIFCLNIFYSGIEYSKEDWVWLKVRHYHLHSFTFCNIRPILLFEYSGTVSIFFKLIYIYFMFISMYICLLYCAHVK